MELTLTEEQEMLKDAARGFLKTRCTPKVVRELEASADGYSPDMWREMAELGWLGLCFPEKYGGMDGNFMDMAIIYEEIGRAALPSPHLSTVMMCGQTILRHGNEKQRSEFLPKIANGQVVLGMALIEPERSWDMNSMTSQATPRKDGFVINGTKLFVSYGHVASHLICVARINDSGARKGGIGLFLVDAASPGLSYTPLKTMGADKQCEVTFSNVMVPREDRLGSDETKDSLVKALEPAILMQAAEMVGGAQKAMEMSIDYAKQRVQFDRPIGSFQVIQHKCADMAKEVEGTRLLVWAAAWKLTEDLPCAKDVSMAKFRANEICRHVIWESHQIHAGVAFQVDHDLHLYSRREMAGEYRLGDKEFHQDIIAREMGLMAS